MILTECKISTVFAYFSVVYIFASIYYIRNELSMWERFPRLRAQISVVSRSSKGGHPNSTEGGKTLTSLARDP